jgi:hypothetical protein
VQLIPGRSSTTKTTTTEGVTMSNHFSAANLKSPATMPDWT